MFSAMAWASANHGQRESSSRVDELVTITSFQAEHGPTQVGQAEQSAARAAGKPAAIMVTSGGITRSLTAILRVVRR
jgi:hypothetical protein